MTSFLLNEIEKRARETAKLFAEEFNEPFDSEASDWDATAWEEDRKGLDLEGDDHYGECWDWYVRCLEEETYRLCKKNSGRYPG